MSEDKLSELVKAAIQMEIDGRAFYSKNAAKIPTEIGRTMFERFAKDENIHLKTFIHIFENTVGRPELISIMNARKKYIGLPIFPRELNEIDWINPGKYELYALHTAMNAEMEAIKYYSGLQQSTEGQLIKEIIETSLCRKYIESLSGNLLFFFWSKSSINCALAPLLLNLILSNGMRILPGLGNSGMNSVHLETLRLLFFRISSITCSVCSSVLPCLPKSPKAK